MQRAAPEAGPARSARNNVGLFLEGTLGPNARLFVCFDSGENVVSGGNIGTQRSLQKQENTREVDTLVPGMSTLDCFRRPTWVHSSSSLLLSRLELSDTKVYEP